MKICGVIKQNPLRVMQLMCLLAVMTGPTYAANWANGTDKLTPDKG